jgi:hypothetical protein
MDENKPYVALKHDFGRGECQVTYTLGGIATRKPAAIAQANSAAENHHSCGRFFHLHKTNLSAYWYSSPGNERLFDIHGGEKRKRKY